MKKQQILNAASDLFLQIGYGFVSMEHVAREANVSKATLYAYFSSKNDLFVASLDYYQQKQKIIPPGLPNIIPASFVELGNQLKDYLQQAFSFYSNDAIVQLYCLLISEIKQFPELFELFFGNQYGKMTTGLANYLGEYAKRHNKNHDGCYILACQILDLVRGASLWAKLVQNLDKQIFLQHNERTILQLHRSSMLLVKDYFRE